MGAVVDALQTGTISSSSILLRISQHVLPTAADPKYEITVKHKCIRIYSETAITSVNFPIQNLVCIFPMLRTTPMVQQVRSSTRFVT